VTPIGDPICKRRLKVLRGHVRKTLVVTLGAPRKRRRAWACPFHISGIGMVEPRDSYGVDAFQALMMALVGIRAALDSSAVVTSWLSTDAHDHGVPRLLEAGFGVGFNKRLERLVAREILTFGRAAERRARRRHNDVVEAHPPSWFRAGRQ